MVCQFSHATLFDSALRFDLVDMQWIPRVLVLNTQ